MSILIETEREGTLRQRIVFNDHDALYTDAPVSAGGDGSAPDPHDYFDVSLATCKALTLIMYARKKEMPLDGVSIRVTRDSSDEQAGQYRLQVDIGLIGDLSAQARDRLLEIAEQCPIHKLMTTGQIDIDTRAHLGGA
ncbi:peroxiredoxin [Kushneria pakistanensis]|uniref:Peroxiredoxin n=1 Tax=Kushneria pakistanensis TaxID=1508770 RepID=A0ABQ3FEE9_9GAMM|nr:OsmC family protein [Kushneria pakistanensis]GHC20410.1 peroxiredoxin [Kushneria pakistanensis]